MVTIGKSKIYQTSTTNIGWMSSVGNLTDELGAEWDFENECVHRANVPAEDGIQDLAYPPLLQIPVYNIEVEDFHTYFVGKEGVWVHNKNLSTAIKVQNDGPALPENTLVFFSKLRNSRVTEFQGEVSHFPIKSLRHRSCLETIRK